MNIKKRLNKGYALILVLFFTGIFLVITIGIMALVRGEINLGTHLSNSIKAFALAESGVQRALAEIRDTGGIATLPANITLAGATGLSDDAALDNAVITLSSAVLGGNVFRVTSSATVGTSQRTITADIMYNPPSEVFDYAYLINNWAWLYGNTITINGDIRSNGRCDNGGWRPRVNGEIFAAQGIGGQGSYRGTAGTVEDGEYIYQHPNSPVLEMPNLSDLSYYEGLAISNNSTVAVGGSILINGVYGDDAGETGNMVLIGTPSNPIEINGPVVITGDVVIKGTIEGQGTIYAGRNVYVADDINYRNAPSSPRPASRNPAVVDNWVTANADKDMVGFAATENVILGDYTASTTGDPWYSNYWLFGMGSEDVGEDGIPATGDTGENDGVFQPATEDLDGDGIFDDNYNWTDIQTQTDITNFTNAPIGITGFGDIATNYLNTVDGIFYTNHAFAGRVGYGAIINGSIISKDEAIIYRNTLMMNYDERANSRYIQDPNWLVDLQLPVAERAVIVGWQE